MEQPARDNTIDAFRGISILLVLTFHFLVRWAPPFNNANLYGFTTIFDPWWELGKYGVYFFFVISGIVISLTIDRSATVLDFVVRRFSRLYPALICAALLTFVVGKLLGPPQFTRHAMDVVASLAMLPSISSKSPFNWVDGVYWSLGVEIKFYIFVALFHSALRRHYWIGLLAIGVLGTAIKPLSAGVADKLLIHEYIAFFLWGIAIYQYSFVRNIRAAIINAVFAVGFFLENASFLTLKGVPADYAVWFVGGGCIIMALMICLHLPLSWRPLAYTGRISYSLYLLHQNIGVIIIAAIMALGGGVVLSILTALGVCYALSVAMFHLVEQPMQKHLRKTFNAWTIGWKSWTSVKAIAGEAVGCADVEALEKRGLEKT